MSVKNLRFATALIIIAGTILALPCSGVAAERRGDSGHGVNRPNSRPSSGYNWGGGDKHYYRDGKWYRHGWLGFDIAVSALTIGALIDSLPPRHTTIVVAGTPYYYYSNYYYQPYPYGGYVVVPPPMLAQSVTVVPQAAPIAAAIMQSQPQVREASTINIPNTRGGYTAVMLTKAGTGYVGPQGEYYSDNPTVEQLKVLYGK
jgi:hypothetical protein